MHVFEYGAGGSTFFFLRHKCNVVSVEHNADWHDIVIKKLGRNDSKEDCCLFLRPPVYSGKTVDYRDEANCVSFDADFYGYNFSDYVKHISQYEDRSFDLILVDGRARRSCLNYAASKIKPGGLLVLDNSDRKEYLEEPFPALKDYEVLKVFHGSPPCLTGNTECTIFLVSQKETLEISTNNQRQKGK